ncbi:hypothetical protein ACFLZZ_02135 [Nanoarchaeota archaeon]
MNKKGQLIEGVLIILALLAFGQALYSVTVHNTAVGESISPPDEVLNFSSNLDKETFFLKEDAKFMIQEAYAKSFDSYGVEEDKSCKTESFNPEGFVKIWSTECKPNEEKTKEFFLNEFSNEKTFTVSFEGDKLIFVPSVEIKKEDFKTSFVEVQVTVPQIAQFSLDYPKFELDLVYEESIKRKNTCSSALLFDACMSGLSFESWDVGMKDKENYLLFTLLSDEKYFYEDSFKPVELRFAIEKSSLTA